LHNEELYNLYATPDIIRVIKLRRWVGHIACIEETSNTYAFLLESLKGRDHLVHIGIDGKIILEWILGKYSGRMWTGCIWLRIGNSGRLKGLLPYLQGPTTVLSSELVESSPHSHTLFL
jgi:hypothetical protein